MKSCDSVEVWGYIFEATTVELRLGLLTYEQRHLSCLVFGYSSLWHCSQLHFDSTPISMFWKNKCRMYHTKEKSGFTNYLDLDLLFYIEFNSQGHIAMGSLQVEEASAYCTVNHQASASNYHYITLH